jgi:hypothetical protein
MQCSCASIISVLSRYLNNHVLTCISMFKLCNHQGTPSKCMLVYAFLVANRQRCYECISKANDAPVSENQRPRQTTLPSASKLNRIAVRSKTRLSNHQVRTVRFSLSFSLPPRASLPLTLDVG